MANNKPINTIRDGALKATIWERTSEKGPFFSVELSRSYRTEDGTWKDSSSFVGDELLRIARLASLAYDETLGHREQARERERAGSPEPNDGRLA